MFNLRPILENAMNSKTIVILPVVWAYNSLLIQKTDIIWNNIVYSKVFCFHLGAETYYGHTRLAIYRPGYRSLLVLS